MNKQEFKFKNKKILIYGFGISGKASFNYLKNKNYVYLYDDNSRLISQKYKKKILSQKKINQYSFDYIVISPGIDLKKCILKNYLKTSIAVVSSRWEEPFGRTSLEASSAGCAVIISDRGGLPETVTNAVILDNLNVKTLYKAIDK